MSVSKNFRTALLRIEGATGETAGISDSRERMSVGWEDHSPKHHTAPLAVQSGDSQDVARAASVDNRAIVAASIAAAHVKSRAVKPWSAVSLSPD